VLEEDASMSASNRPLAPPADIGVVGLGAMGAPMARRLAGAGYRLHVADAVPDAVDRFRADTPCEAPKDLKNLGAACDAVITMLPDGAAVRQVLIGERGAVAGFRPGTVAIDMSSSSPTGTRALAAELKDKGVDLVDAPVSGGVPRAVDGTLAIMVGGEADVVQRVLPPFAPMGTATPVGGPGSGHAMKALNNYLSAANLTTAAEALIAGVRFGLDPKVMMDVFNMSSGRNTGTAQKIPAYVLTRSFDSGFALKLMAKDLRLALEVARAAGAETKLLEDTSAIYDAAEAMLGPQADNTDVVRYLESLVEDSDGRS
jgi:3-hydroxyisobutyrate dehydrogenase